ncbi:MAG: hypothetical protein AB8G95_31030 [Anaerolineae bacterium]
MIYADIEIIKMMAEEKRYKPLMIEGIIIQHTKQTGIWRQQLVALLCKIASSFEAIWICYCGGNHKQFHEKDSLSLPHGGFRNEYCK